MHVLYVRGVCVHSTEQLFARYNNVTQATSSVLAILHNSFVCSDERIFFRILTQLNGY